jgi:hypothetical protein
MAHCAQSEPRGAFYQVRVRRQTPRRSAPFHGAVVLGYAHKFPFEFVEHTRSVVKLLGFHRTALRLESDADDFADRI